MQQQKSWSDAVKEARAARETARRVTPEGYYHGQGETAVMNLNRPGAFAAIQANDATAFARSQGAVGSSPSNPRAAVTVSPPAKEIAGGQEYAPGLWSTINPRTAPTNAGARIGYGRTNDPYVNTNWEGPTMYGFPRPGSYQGNELGDFLTDLTGAISAGAQAFTSVTAAETLASRGISPVGYSANGVPLYQSTPPGVTPQYGAVVPSGLVLPAGVTPSFPYPVGFVQQAGASGAYQIQPPSFMTNPSNLLPALLIGGGLLALFVILK